VPEGAAAASGRMGTGAALAALVLLTIALTLTPITNNDLFLHLRTGSIVLATGSVPRVDDYSALAAGRPFVAHEWLSGVIFRLVEMAGGSHGFDALVLLKVGVAILIALVLVRAAAFLGAPVSIAIPCAAFVMLLAAARFLERPHILGSLLLVATLALLARRRARLGAGLPDRSPRLLFPLQIAWANLHGSFVLGPAIVGLAAVSSAIEGLCGETARREARLRESGRLALLVPGLLVASLVNPYGVALLKFPFALTSSAFMGQIYEWMPPYTEPFRSSYMARYYALWAVGGAIALALAFVRARRRREPAPWLFQALLFAGFFVLSLRMNRQVTDFALATCPGVAAALGTGARRRAPGPSVWLGMTCVLLALTAWIAVAGYPMNPSNRRPLGLGLGRSIPVAAADYVERNRLAGNVFNTYGTGAYLVYRFHPAVRVAMDSRNDVYGEALWLDYQRALTSPAELARMLTRIDAAFIFLEWTQPGVVATASAIRGLERDWLPVYFDDTAVIYLDAAGPRADLARRDGYRRLDPSLFRPGGWSAAEAQEALVESERAVLASGDSCIARVMRIDALMTLGRTAEARDEEDRLVALDPPLYHVHILLGILHLARGERDLAAARLRRALELNPASGTARQALAQATGAS
jgi:hypothetical protein